MRRSLIAFAILGLTSTSYANNVILPIVGEVPQRYESATTSGVGDGVTDALTARRYSRFYYQVGTGLPRSQPPVTATVRIRAQANIGLGYSCGKFDPVASLTDSFNNLGDELRGALNVVQQSATAAVQAAPMLLLQRVNPGLYQLMQHHIVGFEEQFRVSALTCQEMERQIAQGGNPFKKWEEFSGFTMLRNTGTSNAKRTMDDVHERGSEHGVYLPNPGRGIQRMGGRNQDAIEVNSIGSVTGYNLAIGRNDVTSVASGTSVTDSKLTHYFPTPIDLHNWLVRVIGERTIHLVDGTNQNNVPGVGLIAVAQQDKGDFNNALLDLVSTRSAAQRQAKVRVFNNNYEISGITLTADLIELVGSSPTRDQLIDALTSQYSVTREIDKALVARRILVTSLTEGNIYKSPMKDEIEESVSLLEREIDMAMLEFRIQREMVSELIDRIYREPRASGSPVDNR
ncbi:hypothetical protein THIAE_06165 [Thiomicrospira aerophila AL3]|uniref:Integrating conjugative element protein n=1 Tax=Thiomicrospira aerophila AL3 TaxID=717772 RepID=W0DYG2_9GAMM|nr:hypothetical protein [Thiomicrospira aerophila]AHF02298.1 hypothetical protein THIAE_06165 [Thiomicrospira aerophila AL3]